MSAVAHNAIILHVGVHKTGSTALQAALAAARPDLAKAGILYPGGNAAHHTEAWAVAGRSFGFGEEANRSPRSRWTRLALRARLHRGRVVISSEFFGRMRTPTIRQVVNGLGRDRVHVVFAVRPLADLLPSSWQQYLKSGLVTDYDEWLHDVLKRRKPKTTGAFWSRADFAWLVRRWTSLVPPERVTGIVLDPADRGLLYRSMEDLMGLPPEWLEPYRAPNISNRSLTAPEAELLRQVNVRTGKSIGWKAYSENIRHGAVEAIVESRVPPADEPRISTPQWALDRARKRQKRDHRRLMRSGIDLRGNPDLLLERRTGTENPVVTQIPVDLAALGLAAAAGHRPDGP